ncbi:MAG: DUF2778 domain-containing protein [Chloroflexota bacterium]
MLTKPQTLNGFLSHDRGRLLAYTVLAAGALSLSLLAGWHGLHRHKITEAAPDLVAEQPLADAGAHSPMIVGLGPWARTAAATSAAPEQTAALEAEIRPSLPGENQEAANEAADVPLPPRKPAEIKSLASRMAPPAPIRQAALPAEPAPAPADNRSFFEKLFGGAGVEQQPTAQTQPAPVTARNGRRQQPAPATQALAYAAPETTGGLFGGISNPAAPAAPAPSTAVGPAPRAEGGTAVYNIATHTVYMPDGTRLEAHSGLREYLDDPRYVHVRMRGPTPPSVYALSPREALFHGVEALRLTPIGNNSIFGRAGLLAHTYMLGPNGDSNGCVSFRDYNAFLEAYKRGAVRRLIVVAGG